MDAANKQILLQHNADLPLPPASLTKIMTSYIAAYEIEQGNFSDEDMVPISVKAWKKPGSKMFVREGTKVSLQQLLKGIIIQSGNDASIAVAEYISGSESAFADLMNQHAKNLGMNNTNFLNSTGWPAEEHLSTAKDLAILTQALISKFPEHYKIYAEKSFSFNNITQDNRNKLLFRDDTVDGVKTGYTEVAGYCLVASSVKDGMRLISVVMGTSGPQARATESQKLLSYGHRFFKTLTTHTPNRTIHQSKIWMGEKNTLDLGVRDSIIVTIPRNQLDQVDTKLILPTEIRAPLSKGEEVGKLIVTLSDQPIVETALITLAPAEQAGFFKRIWHAILLFFDGLI